MEGFLMKKLLRILIPLVLIAGGLLYLTGKRDEFDA